MELKKYKVYLGGVLLSNIPKGLDSLLRTFERDNNFFGIYSISTYSLVFVGDGYCILRDFQQDYSACDLEIKIDSYCNGVWANIFNGIIELGSIEINESKSEGICDIQDSSPIALLSRNSEVDIDLQTNVDLFGNAITPATPYNITLSNIDGTTSYNSKMYLAKDALKTIIEAITGTDVNIVSNYFSKSIIDCSYQITVTGTLSNFVSATIVYKNFQGDTITAVATGAGSNALDKIGYVLSPYSSVLTNAGVLETMKVGFDNRNFYDFTYDIPSQTISLYSSLPIEILSVDIDGAGMGISFTKISDFDDGGQDAMITNYRLLHNQDNPARLSISLKLLMQELNKLYNVYFLASYDNAGKIDIRLENYDYFANAAVNFTFNNAQELKVSFDEDSASRAIQTGEDSNNTLTTSTFTFGSEFCGIGQTFDAKNNSIIGSYQIFEDLLTYDETAENKIYIFENSAIIYNIHFVNAPVNPWLFKNANFYNLHLSNYHKIYRHFNKFRDNILGNISVLPEAPLQTFSARINIKNTSTNRLFKRYEFVEYMKREDFDKLFDIVSDKVEFKKQNDTVYRRGLIKTMNYDEFNGKAEITLIGE